MKALILIFMLSLCGFLTAQDHNLNLSVWHTNDAIKASDYQSVKKTGMYWFLSNDKDNIYISLKITDTEIQDLISGDGLTIWIDMDGKHSKKMGVRYLSKSETKMPSSQTNTIELIGFITEQERHFAADNPDNFKASVKKDENGIVFFRMIMPVSKLPLRNSQDGRGTMPFSLGVEAGSSPSGKAGNSQLYWINHVKLATSQ
jgi:hypothetical protein